MVIIEHPTKGLLTELPYDRDEKAHFRWAVNRRGPEPRRLTEAEARRLLPILPEGCYMLDLDTLEPIA